MNAWQTIALLERTKAVIIDGWCQGTSCIIHGDGTEQHDLSSALRKSCNSYSWEADFDAGRQALKNAMHNSASRTYLSDWNDNKAKTVQDVIDLIDRAIEEL
jgi:hypothetical protein